MRESEDLAETAPLLLPMFTPSPLDSIPIYSIVLDTYDLVAARVDMSLKYDQLKSPQVNSFLVRPLVAELKLNLSLGTIYALIANMLQFSKESESDVSMNGIMNTRSMVCGIVAMKLLKEYTEGDDLVSYNATQFRGKTPPLSQK